MLKTNAIVAKLIYYNTALTSFSDVKTFLRQCSKLKVEDITENVHAKPGGVLYEKFMTARGGLSHKYQHTCLAFHGTPEANIPNICKNGYDTSKRKRQRYGPGECFAATPEIPLKYCGGGKMLLLNELLLGQEDIHHTRSDRGIIVMKYPEHDLPRFIITFK